MESRLELSKDCFGKQGALRGTEYGAAGKKTSVGTSKKCPRLPVETKIIQLTGPVTVQMACSWQPPLNPSAQGFIGRHVNPSPLYPF